MTESVQYESAAISRRAVLIGTAGLLGVLVVSTVAAAVFARLWWPAGTERRADVELFAGSKLDPALARSRMQREQVWAARAHGYAWVDREAGVARIPVDRAIELILARPLVAAQEPAP